jgi:hypothetical protein
MKKRYVHGLQVFARVLFIAAVLFLAACDNLLLKPPVPLAAGSGETGAVHITLSNGRPADTPAAASLAAPRTLYPDTGVMWYRFEVSTENDALTVPPAMDLLPGQTEADLTLPVGTWTFTVTGFIGEDAIVEGERTVTLTNVPQAVTIAVTRPAAGTGTLHYAIDYSDANITDAEITLSKIGEDAEPADPITRNITANGEGTIDCPSGFYLLTAALTGGDRPYTVTWTNTVHIYPNHTTEAAKTFGKGDFVYLILGGTIGLTVDTSVSANYAKYITAYTDEAYETPVGSSSISNGTWAMDIASFYGSPVIYFRAELKEGNEVTYSKSAGSIPTPMDDKNDIALGAVNITLLDITDSPPEGGDIILISNAAELAAINDDITNLAKNYGKNTYILTNDITLTGAWTPIGNIDADSHNQQSTITLQAADTPFTGRFYGNGYTIRGLQLPAAVTSNQGLGLFGATFGAVIKDLTVETGNTRVQVDSGYYFGIGGIAGIAEQTELTNISVSLNITVDHTDVSRDIYVGGVAGYASAGMHITNVTAAGNLTVNVTNSRSYAGGIAGYMEGTVIDSSSSVVVGVTTDEHGECYGGGLIGRGGGMIQSSYATGAVSVNNVDEHIYVGGLIGETLTASTIDTCYATGAVNAHGSGGIGGLIGVSRSAVSMCYAAGKVTVAANGQVAVGGLTGDSYSSVSMCYATGEVVVTGGGTTLVGGLTGYNTGMMQVSYSTGDINVEATFLRLGGVAGENYNTITMCYATGKINGVAGGYAHYTGGIVGFPDSGSSITNSAALNSTIVGAVTSSRIIPEREGTDIHTSNIAFGAMLVNDAYTIDAETDPQNDINGLGKTAAQLKQRAAYETGLGWDFANTWEMGSGNYPYPLLKWQNGVVHTGADFEAIQDIPALAVLAANNYRIQEGQGGSSDNLANPGESIYLDLPVKNVGGIAAAGVQATISSESPYITFDQNTTALGSVDAGYYKILTGAQALSASSLTYFSNQDNALRLTIAADCPDGSSIPLTVTFTDSSNRRWAFPLSLPIAPNPPATPAGLTVTDIDASHVSLTWNEISGPKTGYNVYRALGSDSNHTKIDTIVSAAYTDDSVEPDTVYYYRVAAFKRVNDTEYEGVRSPPVSGTTSGSVFINDSTITAYPSADSAELLSRLSGYFEQLKTAGEGSSPTNPAAVTLNIPDVSILKNGEEPLGVLFSAIPDGLFVSYDLSNNSITEIPDTPMGVVTARAAITQITAITLPQTLTKIGRGAFTYFRSLVSINIPDNVLSIGIMAFYDCFELTGVTIGDGVTSIGASAFGDCYGLTSIVIPDGVTTIGDYAFDLCTGLISIVIPESVTAIGYNAFRSCANLDTVTFTRTTPPVMGTPGSSPLVFYDCPSLSAIVVPLGTVEAYETAFPAGSYVNKEIITDQTPQPVTFGLTADGSLAAATTKLVLTFAPDIAGLTPGDNIILSANGTGAAAGTLTPKGSGEYELTVNGITASGEITVKVVKRGYRITPTFQTVAVICTGSNGIPVSFTGLPQDETIELGADRTLLWSDNTALIISLPSDFESYQWFLDGEIMDGQTGSGITLYAGDYWIKDYRLSVRVSKNGKTYSKTVIFTVEL